MTPFAPVKAKRTGYLVTVLLLLLALQGCATRVPVPYTHSGPPETAELAKPDAIWLGRHVSPIVSDHPDHSGLLLLDKGEEALLWRGVLANHAERTIEAQYFIWSEDNVGTLAAEKLLRAAQRGVRIRVLVDDFPVATDPRFIALLNAHPRISIRVYNPSGIVGRSGTGKMLAMLGDFKRLNRRMHNKLFLVDGTVAILGGRNVADEYYDMHEDYNFRDRDVLAIGPVVPKLAKSFDEYWNSPWAVPVEALTTINVTPAEQNAYYTALHEYASHPEHFPARFNRALADTDRRLAKLGDELVWAQTQVIYDTPGKNDDVSRMDAFGRSGERLTHAVLQAHSEILAETPYLIMLPGTFEVVEKLIARGVDVRILTNSLGSTDNMAAFAGYASQRRKMLRMGVHLYELRPDAALREQVITRYPLIEGKGELGLHAKTIVIDRNTVFIGSFNMDPRSTHLNTEMGLLIESAQFARQVANVIEQDMAPQNAWRVELTDQGDIEWVSRRQGKELRHDTTDPDGSFGKSLQFLLFSILPLGSIL